MGMYDNYLKSKKMGFGSEINPLGETQNSPIPQSPVFKQNAPAANELTPSKPSFSSFANNLNVASGAIGAVGSILGVGGAIYDAYLRRKYQDKIFKMEKERVNRQLNREARANGTLSSVWGK